MPDDLKTLAMLSSDLRVWVFNWLPKELVASTRAFSATAAGWVMPLGRSKGPDDEVSRLAVCLVRVCFLGEAAGL